MRVGGGVWSLLILHTHPEHPKVRQPHQGWGKAKLSSGRDVPQGARWICGIFRAPWVPWQGDPHSQWGWERWLCWDGSGMWGVLEMGEVLEIGDATEIGDDLDAP